jgi:O-antigen/teichoic acid export membrane protein
MIYLGILLGIVLSVTNPVWILFAIGESGVHALFVLVTRAIALIPLYLSDITLPLAIAIMVLPMLVSNIMSILVIAIRRRISMQTEGLSISVTRQLSEGRSIFANSVIVSLVAALWPLLLSPFVTKADIGIYGIADKVMRGLITLVSPMQNFLLASSDKRCTVHWIGAHPITFVIASGVVVTIPVIFAMIPNEFLAIIFGASILDARTALNLYAFGFIFGAIHLVAYVEMVKHRQESVYKYLFLASVMTAIMFVSVYGTPIYSPLATEVIIALTALFWLWRMNKSPQAKVTRRSLEPKSIGTADQQQYSKRGRST